MYGDVLVGISELGADGQSFTKTILNNNGSRNIIQRSLDDENDKFIATYVDKNGNNFVVDANNIDAKYFNKDINKILKESGFKSFDQLMENIGVGRNNINNILTANKMENGQVIESYNFETNKRTVRIENEDGSFELEEIQSDNQGNKIGTLRAHLYDEDGVYQSTLENSRESFNIIRSDELEYDIAWEDGEFKYEINLAQSLDKEVQEWQAELDELMGQETIGAEDQERIDLLKNRISTRESVYENQNYDMETQLGVDGMYYNIGLDREDAIVSHEMNYDADGNRVQEIIRMNHMLTHL
jgi:hypothetical protein